jgi:transmembrane protein EpsG
LIAGSVLVALGLSKFMGGILNMTDALGGNYDESSFVGEGVNIFRVLVVFVPVILSFFLRNTFTDDEENRTPYLIMNLSMVNAFVMFIGLFGTANYFARLANYFLIFQALSLPWLLKQFVGKSKRIMLVGSLVCYGAYFYYGTVIANGAFDDGYRFITLAEFLKQLL